MRTLTHRASACITDASGSTGVDDRLASTAAPRKSWSITLRRSVVSLFSVGVVFGVFTFATGGAAAAVGSPCLQPTTTGDAGRIVYVSSCAVEVVITSPDVRTVYGSSGNDIIRAALNVEAVYGGEGNDTIYAGPSTTTIEGGIGEDKIYGEPEEIETGEEPPVAGSPSSPSYEPAPQVSTSTAEPQATASSITPVECKANPCLGGNGNQLLRGGPGNDEIFGERGNDEIYGEGGEDALYGGTGDDMIKGGEGNDYISGGAGSDTIFGEAGNDLVQGDATIDMIYGGTGEDTLSFATGVTPGFEGAYPSSVKHVEGFPENTNGEGRGVFVRLDGGATNCGSYQACDGGAGFGGGNDEIATSEIENVIGTAFPDIIVGSSGANKIYGGGGGDVIIGGGGTDTLYGGEGGDYIEDSGSSSTTAYGGKGANNCAWITWAYECPGTKAKVTQNEAAKMSAGLMMVKNPVDAYDAAYLLGSTGADEVNASLSGTTITFTSYGTTRFAGESEGCTYEEEGKKAKCAFPASSPKIDAIVMAGLAGNDHLAVGGGGFPLASGPILLGGEGNDTLIGGGTSEDIIVDGNGTGADTLKGYGYDDWLTNNEGVDLLEGGAGNDVELSTTTCDGDTLYGAEESKADGAARNNASWAKLPAPGGVTAMLMKQSAGSYYNEATKSPGCTSGTTDTLIGFQDLEGSNQSDALFGDGGENLINGHHGEDLLSAEGGNDEIEAQDGEKDRVFGGEGTDICVIDREIDERSGCETTEPPLISTLVATPTVEPHNGEPGSGTVKGSVYAGEGSLSGRYVNVNYSKEEKPGEWVLKSTQHPTLTASGTYSTSEGVGVGKWRVKVVFPEQGPFLASESGYVSFTISSK
jgi:Ca2+-binding RTX toxin-like protein